MNKSEERSLLRVPMILAGILLPLVLYTTALSIWKPTLDNRITFTLYLSLWLFVVVMFVITKIVIAYSHTSDTLIEGFQMHGELIRYLYGQASVSAGEPFSLQQVLPEALGRQVTQLDADVKQLTKQHDFVLRMLALFVPILALLLGLGIAIINWSQK